MPFFIALRSDIIKLFECQCTSDWCTICCWIKSKNLFIQANWVQSNGV